MKMYIRRAEWDISRKSILCESWTEVGEAMLSFGAADWGTTKDEDGWLTPYRIEFSGRRHTFQACRNVSSHDAYADIWHASPMELNGWRVSTEENKT